MFPKLFGKIAQIYIEKYGDVEGSAGVRSLTKITHMRA